MKKQTKVTLLIFAAITVITSIAAIVMLAEISGDNLFYVNSTLGYIYAVSYRWVCLASGMFFVAWILLILRKRKAIASKLIKLMKLIQEENGEAEVTALTAVTLEKDREDVDKDKLGDINGED